MYRFTTLSAAILVGALPLVACEDSSTDPAELEPNIVEVAQSVGNFNTLLAAVEAAGLTSTLADDGPFTVFAPTDEAFAQIPEEDLEALLADTEALTAVLTYHVVAGKLSASEVVGLSSIETLNGSSIQVAVEGDAVRLNGGATVVITDVEASNGIIHVIDQVLLPPES